VEQVVFFYLVSVVLEEGERFEPVSELDEELENCGSVDKCFEKAAYIKTLLIKDEVYKRDALQNVLLTLA
jgi:hypothetical protein